MNLKFTIFIVLLQFTLSSALFGQAPRTILVEDFSSATCPPCAATNPIFRAFLEPFGKSVVSVAFQCHIPVTGDPMYAQNIPDVSTRVAYYAINTAPNCGN